MRRYTHPPEQGLHKSALSPCLLVCARAARSCWVLQARWVGDSGPIQPSPLTVHKYARHCVHHGN